MAAITGDGVAAFRQPFWPPPPPADHADGHVDAALCRRGHANHPRVAFCHSCGLAMRQAAPRMVRVPRPPLGLMIDDQGRAHVLDGDYVIGFRPETEHAVVRERARPLPVEAPDGEPVPTGTTVAVHLSGWQITVCLLRGERPDTLIAYPPYHHWSPLVAGQPAAVPSDTRFSIAGHAFAIESHWPI